MCIRLNFYIIIKSIKLIVKSNLTINLPAALLLAAEATLLEAAAEATLLEAAALLEAALMTALAAPLRLLGTRGTLDGSTAGARHVGSALLAVGRVDLKVELDGLTFGEGLVAISVDGGVVDEVLGAVLAGDETESLLGVEKLAVSLHGHV